VASEDRSHPPGGFSFSIFRRQTYISLLGAQSLSFGSKNSRLVIIFLVKGKKESVILCSNSCRIKNKVNVEFQFYVFVFLKSYYFNYRLLQKMSLKWLQIRP
jgi:hypothetical protein